jgi:hypothetical protein
MTPQSNNHNVEVKTGPRRNNITHCTTLGGENNPMPKCTMHGDTNASIIKPHKIPQTGYNNTKA